MLCNFCGAESESDFCPNCGAPLEIQNYKTCRVCGTKGKYEFCKNCGTPFEDADYKTCRVCGTKGKYEFCKNCGTPFESEAPKLQSNNPFSKKFIMAISCAAVVVVVAVVSVIVVLSLNRGAAVSHVNSSGFKTALQSSQAPQAISSQVSASQASSATPASSAGSIVSSVSRVASSGSSAVSSSAPATAFVPDYTSDQKNTYGNTVANVLNSGIAATQGDWIYYANSNNEGKGVQGIYKIKNDGSGKMKIDSGYDQNINVVGDWIYYSSTGGICKIRTDGSNKTILCTANASISYVYVVNDEIYYSCAGGNSSVNGIWKMDTDGGSKKQLVSCKPWAVNYVGDWIYYINESDSTNNGWTIYKVQTDGSHNARISQNFEMQEPYIEDGWDYYAMYSKTLNKLQISAIGDNDNSNAVVLDNSTGVVSLSINTDPNWVYYGSMTDNSGGGGLYRISNNGTQKQTLATRGAININIVGNWIYYQNAAQNQYVYKMELNGSGNQAVN